MPASDRCRELMSCRYGLCGPGLSAEVYHSVGSAVVHDEMAYRDGLLNDISQELRDIEPVDSLKSIDLLHEWKPIVSSVQVARPCVNVN